MKFRFQNKKQELFLIHEDDKREGLHAELGWDDWEVHEPPTEPAWEDCEIHEPPTEPYWEEGEIREPPMEPDWEEGEIHEPPKESAWDTYNQPSKDLSPTPPTTPKKTKKAWCKKTTSLSTIASPGMDESTSA